MEKNDDFAGEAFGFSVSGGNFKGAPAIRLQLQVSKQGQKSFLPWVVLSPVGAQELIGLLQGALDGTLSSSVRH